MTTGWHRRPRGAGLAGRIAAAEARLEALAADYPVLAAETMAELRGAWSALAADEGGEAAHLRLQRAAHALKGEGASCGYPLVSAVAGSLCLALQAGQARHPATRPAVGAHVAVLEAVLEARLAGAGGALGRQLMLGLHARVAEAAAAARRLRGA